MAIDEPQELDLSGVTLRVSAGSVGADVALAVIEQSGAFADAEYEIDWSVFDGPEGTVEAMLAGAVDVGLPGATAAVILAQGNAPEEWNAADAPLRMVSLYQPVEDAGAVVLVGSDSGIETLEDLAGKRVTYVKAGPGHILMSVISGETGLEYEEILLPGPEGRIALTTGAVDALVTLERNGMPLISDGTARVIARATDYYPTVNGATVVSAALDDPVKSAAVADFLERLDVAYAWSTDNIDLLAEIYQTVGSSSPEDALVAARQWPRLRVTANDEVIASLQEQADALAAIGELSRPVDVTILIDLRFES